MVLFSFVVVMGLEPAISVYVIVPRMPHSPSTGCAPFPSDFQCDGEQYGTRNDQCGFPEESTKGHSEVCIRTCLVFWAGLSRSDVVGLCAVRVLALARGGDLEQTIQANGPKPDNLCALREIIKGRPADSMTMQRLVVCNLVEEFNGTAILTERGIKAAMRLVLGNAKKQILDRKTNG
jgi:hypothetical protein